MDLKDLIVTPFLILVVYFFAYVIRNKVSDNWTRRYFIPALSLKNCGRHTPGSYLSILLQWRGYFRVFYLR